MFCIPREILGIIVNCLDAIDAVSVGRSNKQLKQDLCKFDFGYHITTPIKFWSAPNEINECIQNIHQHVIGCFTSFFISDKDTVRHLPSETKRIFFEYSFNDPIDDLVLPQYLTHLTFGASFNQSIDNLKLPKMLIKLAFGYYFNQSVDKLVLPESLTQLEFSRSGWFDQCIEKLKLPFSGSFTHLTLGYAFNKPITNLHLPDSLTHLTFGHKFNHSVDNFRLPKSLKHLKFGTMFNKSLDHIIFPESMARLIMASHINQFINEKNFSDASWYQELQHPSYWSKFKQHIQEFVLILPPSRIQHTQQSLTITTGGDFQKSLDKLFEIENLQLFIQIGKILIDTQSRICTCIV